MASPFGLELLGHLVGNLRLEVSLVLKNLFFLGAYSLRKRGVLAVLTDGVGFERDRTVCVHE